MKKPLDSVDDALLGRLRKAIGSGNAVSVGEQDQLEAVLRLLLADPAAVEMAARVPGTAIGASELA